MDKEKKIEQMMKNLEITREEALELWLCDNGESENEEQKELNEKCKTVKVDHGIATKKGGKKKVERKPDLQKEEIIKFLFDSLNGREDFSNVKIENVGKIITFEQNGEKFKLDLIKTRKAKK
jgi:hypothetical protein